MDIGVPWGRRLPRAFKVLITAAKSRLPRTNCREVGPAWRRSVAGGLRRRFPKLPHVFAGRVYRGVQLLSPCSGAAFSRFQAKQSGGEEHFVAAGLGEPPPAVVVTLTLGLNEVGPWKRDKCCILFRLGRRCSWLRLQLYCCWAYASRLCADTTMSARLPL